jgi:hypothetical protein
MQHEMPTFDQKNDPIKETCVPKEPEVIRKQGRKDDSGKLDWSLVDFGLLEGMVHVLMKGAVKYDRDNWKIVPDPIRRYTNALKRHLFAIDQGEMMDQEDNEHHIDHVLCCALFLKYFYSEKEKECKEKK